MFQNFVDYVIRPKRRNYSLLEDLGPGVFLIDKKFCCERIDFEVKNKRGQILQGSLFHRSIDKERQYPLIVYCHGSSGNRTESYDTVCCMLRLNILVVSFDFAGCGLSEGSNISLGYYEKDDIRSIFDYINQNFDFIDNNRIGIWGRSMGAVSSILYTASNSNIRLLVLDSPFKDLSLLLKEYIDKYKILSKVAGKYIYRRLKEKIIEQAGFNFEDVSPIQVLNKITASLLFVHGSKDLIVPFNHSKDLFDQFSGEKDFFEIDVGHNDTRPEKCTEYISKFIVGNFSSTKRSPQNQSKQLKELIQNAIAMESQASHKIEGPQRWVENHMALEGDTDDDNNETQENEISLQNFERRANRRALYYKPNTIYIQEEDLNEGHNKEEVHVSSFKAKSSVELTTLIAAKKTNKSDVLIKNRSLTITVCKSDAEDVANMMNIFEELKEDEMITIGPSDEPRNMISPRKKIHITRSWTVDEKSLLGAENLDAEDLCDTGIYEKKDALEPFIYSAAGSNFELFRQKKSMCPPFSLSKLEKVDENNSVNMDN